MALLRDVIMDVPESYSNYNLSRTNRFDCNPGICIPVLSDEVLPGDHWEIRPTGKVTTAPALAPLMGSFLQEVAYFFIPTRLYVQGMDLNIPDFSPADTNFPTIAPNLFTTSANTASLSSQWSILRSYMQPNLFTFLDMAGEGCVRLSRLPSTAVNNLSLPVVSDLYQNAIPAIGYYDIIRSYFRNTQEPYMYGFFTSRYASLPADPSLPVGTNIKSIPQEGFDNFIKYFVNQSSSYVGSDAGWGSDFGELSLTDFQDAWNRTIVAACSSANLPIAQSPDEVPGIPYESGTITLPNSSWANGYMPHTLKYEGLMFRTHRPDMFTAWLNSGTYQNMLQSSRINVSNNQITMTQLFLSSHMYDYDIRGLISGGRYSDWIYSEYGVRTDRNLCIPQLLGVHREQILFDEIVGQAGTADPGSSDGNYLGQLAGKGRGFLGGRPIKFNATEHGYIMAIYSIVPNVSYSQGHNPMYDKTRFGDLYAPALARIGFQGLPVEWMFDGTLFQQNTNTGDAYPSLVPVSQVTPDMMLGYQPAWQEYRTSVNRTHGAFAVGKDLDYWAITRDFTVMGTTQPDSSSSNFPHREYFNGSTYVLPFEYNYPFVDQREDAGNFLIQLSFNIKARRRIPKMFTPKMV